MTRRRWIADQVVGNRAALVGDHAVHLARVLRAQVGQEFDIATDDRVRRGRIVSIAEDRVEFELSEEVDSEASFGFTLILSVFKFDRMEWAIEKSVELGVSLILPVIARRTDSHLASAAVKRSQRWQRIVQQAAEQSRRAAVPEIAAPVKLSKIFNLEAPLRIVLSESERGVPLQNALRDLAQVSPAKRSLSASQIALAIGPEGGWSDDELQSFRQAGWVAASLGKTILRAETAAIAALAIAGSTVTGCTISGSAIPG